MDKIEIKYITNREPLFLLGALFLLYNILGTYFYDFVENGGVSNNILILSVLIVTILLHFIPLFIGMKVSRNLNRNPFLWGLLCFIFPFIGLVVLSKIDYNFPYEHKNEIKKIIGKFKIELEYLKYDLQRNRIDKNIYYSNRNIFETEFNDKLNLLINSEDFYKAENSDTEKQAIEDNSNEIEIEFEYCPACNYKLDKNNSECPDCGLSLV